MENMKIMYSIRNVNQMTWLLGNIQEKTQQFLLMNVYVKKL